MSLSDLIKRVFKADPSGEPKLTDEQKAFLARGSWQNTLTQRPKPPHLPQSHKPHKFK